MVLQRRWYRGSVWLFSLVSLLWVAHAVAGLVAPDPDSDLPTLMKILAAGQIAVATFLVYCCLAKFVNKTTIRVLRGSIRVQHHPLPWRGGVQVRAKDVDQVYCQQWSNATFSVDLLLRDKRHATLIDSLESLEEALYVEQEIERFLEIEDAAIRGEIARD